MLFKSWEPISFSRNACGLAGCNYKYPTRPPQGEQEKARRRRQMAKGMLKPSPVEIETIEQGLRWTGARA
jgi:hypothetical protein